MANIVQTRPPNYAAILAVFPSAQKPGVIFSYYPNIHYLGGTELPPELVAHEEVHLFRQRQKGVEAWWGQYLTDPTFRYNEEILAHRIEYQHLASSASCRQMRRQALKRTSQRLSSALYGGMVSSKKAAEDIMSSSV